MLQQFSRLLASAALALLLVACGNGVQRDESGAIVEEGEISAFDLSLGDCFNDPQQSEAGMVSDLAAVPCSAPHDNEVFHLVDYPSGPDVPFPGATALQAFATEQCEPAFERYVGIPYLESKFFWAPFLPTEESWANTDREVVCVLFAGEGKLEGSKRGSNE